MLSLMANLLFELSFRHIFVHNLNPNHIIALVNHWKGAGIAVSTIKNRTSIPRWWAERIGKDNAVAKTLLVELSAHLPGTNPSQCPK